MNMNRLDDLMNALLMVVLACTAMLAGVGAGDGKTSGSRDAQISPRMAQVLPAAPVTATQIPRITVVGKRSVAVVASLY
ncbi:hypothetical protein [Niveibacterium sp.]|uniref:hypothetical protein n=1 Tax=Niveibacterium sp. TaxID=2017444 RepID=UPI0035B46A5C